MPDKPTVTATGTSSDPRTPESPSSEPVQVKGGRQRRRLKALQDISDTNSITGEVEAVRAGELVDEDHRFVRYHPQHFEASFE